MILKDRCGVK